MVSENGVQQILHNVELQRSPDMSRISHYVVYINYRIHLTFVPNTASNTALNFIAFSEVVNTTSTLHIEAVDTCGQTSAPAMKILEEGKSSIN